MCLSLVDFTPFGLPLNQLNQLFDQDINFLVERGVFCNLPLYNSEEGSVKFAYFCSSGAVIHRYESLTQDQFIIKCPKDFEWHFATTKQSISLEFKFRDGTLTLPPGFHWGSVVNEIMKQIRHCGEWFMKHYFIYARNSNYQQNIN